MDQNTTMDLEAVAAAMLARGFSELLEPEALDDDPVADGADRR